VSSKVVIAVAFAVGALTGAGGVYAGSRGEAPKPVPVAAAPEVEDCSSLRAANAALTSSLHACDRLLAEAPSGDPSPAPAPSAASDTDRRERRRGREGDGGARRNFGEPSKDDWERMAQLGVVRARIPCVRDKPWTPPQRTLDRLGLAPDDAKTLEEAYAKSNKRVADQVKPLCAQVLGSADVAERVGTSACMDAIASSARRTAPDATKESLTRAAEVQAGKRGAPAAGAATPPIEALALALANETKAFESDLAQKLGPEEAKRLTWAPEMCADRRTLAGGDPTER